MMMMLMMMMMTMMIMMTRLDDDGDADSADGAVAPADGGAASKSCGNMCDLPRRAFRVMIDEARNPTPKTRRDQIPP